MQSNIGSLLTWNDPLGGPGGVSGQMQQQQQQVFGAPSQSSFKPKTSAWQPSGGDEADDMAIAFPSRASKQKNESW